MKLRHKRMLWVVLALLVLGAVTALVLQAFRSNMVFFYTPTQLLSSEGAAGSEAVRSGAATVRLGGLVLQGSLERRGVQVRFTVTDMQREVPVVYEGLLPDLFKEGKGVVAQGHWRDGVFVAQEVLAKHDENYMPPEVAASLPGGAKP